MERLRGFPRRFRFPWRSAARIRRDVADELAFHLSAKTEALQRDGLSVEQAHAEALRQFGDLEAAREQLVADDRRGEQQSRWLTMLDDFGRDTKHAWRTLSRSPGFTAVAVLVLALGIGVVSTMFNLINVTALKPALMDNPDELLAVYSQNTETLDRYRGFSYAEFEAVRDENRVFSSLAGWYFDIAGVEEGDVTRRVSTAFVSADYFETLAVPPARGRAFTLAEERGEDPATVVVSHGFWVRHGRDPGMLGSTVRVNGQPLVVVGIAAEDFTGTNTVLAHEIWVPLAFIERVQNDGRQRRLQDPAFSNLFLFGRMRDDVSGAAIESELRALARGIDANLPSPDGARYAYIAAPMPRLSVSTRPEEGSAGGLAGLAMALMGMGAIVLLIACLNLANMFLARGASRRMEMAIRQSLGSGRARLIRQLLTEGLLLSLMGGAAALLGAYWTMRWIVVSLAAVVPQGMAIRLDAQPDLLVLLVTAAACIIATALFGLGPAWRVTGHHLLSGLKVSATGGAFAGPRQKLRLLASGNLLIVAQLALSLVMLTAGGLFVRGAMVAAHTSPGFSIDSSLLVELDASLAGFDEPRTREVYGQVIERLRSLPQVESAAITSQVPFSGLTSDITVQPAGRSRGEDVTWAYDYVVGDAYFDALRLPLLRGREFTAAEATFDGNSRVAIISEPLARQLFGDRDALGGSIQLASDGANQEPQLLEIVGIARGTRQSLQEELSRHIYLPTGQTYVPNMYVHLRIDERVADPSTLLDRVRNEIGHVDPVLPVLTLTTLRDFVDENIELWFIQLGGRLFTWLGVTALFMALVGVYGVMAFLVSRRTREIGVRMALGATRAKITRQIVREGLGVTLAGVVPGLLLAAAVAQLLSNMLYEVSPMDPLVFAGATLFLSSAATLASYLPVRRVGRIEPTTALRYE